MNIMSYDVFTNPLETIEFNTHQQIINTINPHSYVTAKNDLLFEMALRQSDILLPDGSGIVLAARLLRGKKITKIAGSDLHYYLLHQLNDHQGKCFYMGASPQTLEKIEKRLQKEFPNIIAEFYSPPFKTEFTQEENEAMIHLINTFEPDVLFVGMTAPKQEKWLFAHKEQLNIKKGCAIGAVFDFYAGTVVRSSPFWIKIHLEWLPRLLKEPKRLWRRNFISTPLFLWDLLQYVLRLKR